MKLIFLITILFLSCQSFSFEKDPLKNGADEILKKSVEVLPDSRKHEKIQLAFLSEGLNGQEAAQRIYELLASGSFKGILAIGGPDPEVTDKLARTITTYLSSPLKGVTLIIAGNESTKNSVEAKLKSLGAEVYFIK
jgi:hypothetical protein